MIAAWLLYAIVVGALLGAGALALERAFRTRGLPTRWIWAASVVASVAWPLGHLGGENRPGPVTPPPVVEPPAQSSAERPVVAIPMEPIEVEVAQESVLRLLDRPILVAWASATGGLGLFFLFLVLRTHRLRRGWREGRVGGQGVLLSEEWGPALVGFLRPEVVLPRWCRDLDERTLRLILDHELEHLRAGDLRLLLLVGTIPVLFPWHLPVWWQLARLRTAVEGDCDLRVLRRHPGQIRPYIDLLLDMGSRSSRPRPLVPMLSEPYETLKRRIRIMTMPKPERPWIRGAVPAGIGAVLIGLACGAPAPTDADDPDGEQPVMMESAQEVGSLPEGRPIPVFTPFSVRPELENRDEVVAALQRAYESLLEDRRGVATAEAWDAIDEEPGALDVRVGRARGQGALDAAAGEGMVTASAHDGALADAETGAVTGLIRDANSGRPLAEVQVFVPGTGRGTLSDPNGRFRIEHVPVGEREVVAHLIGYRDERAGISVATDDGSDVDFLLQQTAIALEPLIIRVSGGSGGPPGD